MRVEPAFCQLDLYDGGGYDNMGLESFFDVGRKISKVTLRSSRDLHRHGTWPAKPWPAEELEELNANIIGHIEVIHEFRR